MNYEFLEHTADAKFRAYGNTLDDAFINSAYAMTSILKGDVDISPEKTRKINVSASSRINLLHDFLEEFLFLIDTESLILSEILKIEIDESGEIFSLSCEAMFDNLKNYDLSGDIKSVTYSEIDVKRIRDGFMTQIVVDI